MFFSKKNLESIEFPNYIHIDGKKFQIEVTFSKKKSSSCKIDQDKIIFRLSSLLTQKQAKEHFNSLMDRISIKAKKQDLTSINSMQDTIEKGYFEFNKETYNLIFGEFKKITLTANSFFIPNKYKENHKILENHISKLLSNKFYDYFSNLLEETNKNTFNFKYKNLEIKNLKSKWGHCTYDNNILLNLKLLNTDFEVLEYVIIHELAHIKEKNHSKDFWYLVQRFCPNYKQLRKYLKDNPPNLFK